MKELSEGDTVIPQIEQPQIDEDEECVVENVRTRVNTDGDVSQKYVCGSKNSSGGFTITHERLEEAVESDTIVVSRRHSQ